MKTKITFTLLVLFISGAILAQSNQDTIQFTKVFGGYRFEQNGTPLTPVALRELLSEYPETEAYMKKAKNLAKTAMIFGYGGGALIGYQLGAAMTGEESEWAVAGVGAGLVGIAIPIAQAAEKNVLKAVKIYNARILEDENYSDAQE